MLAAYHLRLAARSVRRDPGLSATIVAVLALAAGMFCTALMHYLRAYLDARDVTPTLHHVELPGGADMLSVAFSGTNAEPDLASSRTRASYPRARVLAGSGLGVAQTMTFRSRLLLHAPDAPDARQLDRPRNARFVNADFFSMFRLAMGAGAPWSREDEARGAAVIVVSRALAEDLWGDGDPVGRTLMVDGRPFRVVGALADDPPFSPQWDRVVTGGPQDLAYLPFDEATRLHARPEVPMQIGPTGPHYQDLLTSGTMFVSFWIDLPTREVRAAYARYLRDTLGARGIRYKLRDLLAVRADLGFPKTVLTFFVFLTFIVLVGAGLVTTRLLLAKGVARRGELSIFRALGAPRGALVRRQLVEAALLAATAGALAMVVAGTQAYFYNRYVADTDVPLVITPASFGITFAATVAVGVLFALFPAWQGASRRPTAALVRS